MPVSEAHHGADKRLWAERLLSRAAQRAPLACALLLALLLNACSQPQEALPGPSASIGAFVPSGVWNDLAALRQLERELGGTFAIAHWYTSWPHPYDPVPVDDLLAHGRVPLVTWQSHGIPVADIAAGSYDDYVREWARNAAQADGEVYVRPFPEMNGDWTDWNGDPEALVVAWRRIARLFTEEGATNVRWVFSPNVSDEPHLAENKMELYYPGHDVVDVLALDGYNWGTTRHHSRWTSFDDVFAAGYDRIAALGKQPVWIAEVASTEHGGNKGQWIEEMLTSVAFPRVEALIWFNEDKETDWRIESSHGSLRAFQAWFDAEGSPATPNSRVSSGSHRAAATPH